MVDGREHIVRVLRDGFVATAELACLAGVGGGVALLLWSVVEPVRQPSGGPVEASATTRPMPSALVRASDPFLRDAGPGNSVAIATGASDYVLFATRAGVEGSGSAILSFGGQPQRAFLAGDLLTPDARLIHIGVDHVVIERDGQRVRVGFTSAPSAPGFAPAAQTGGTSTASPLENMGLRPATRDGRTVGYELIQRGELAMLSGSALQPGDILLSVNGQSISEESIAEHRAALLSGAPVEISFERGGAVQTLRLGQPPSGQIQ